MAVLALPEQSRGMAVVGVRVALAHQLHDPVSEALGQGVPGTPAAVAMDQCGGAVTTIPGQ